MADGTHTAIEAGKEATDRVREALGGSVVAQKAKDAAYTVVGLSVMGTQRATAATKQVVSHLGLDDAKPTIDVDSLRGRTEDAAKVARRQLTKADEVVGGALARIEEAFAPIEERLPDQARETVTKARTVGRDLHAQLRARLASTDRHGASATPAKSKPKHKDATPDEG